MPDKGETRVKVSYYGYLYDITLSHYVTEDCVRRETLSLTEEDFRKLLDALYPYYPN